MLCLTIKRKTKSMFRGFLTIMQVFLYSLRIYFPPHSKYIVRADDEQVGLSMARTRQDRIMDPFCLFNEAYSIPIRFSIRSDFNAGLCGP